MSADEEHAPAAVTVAGHIAVKLSPFSTSESRAWFRRTEGQFRLAKIANSTTKADFVMQALPEEVFFAISPWLDDQPETLDYDKLKQHLLEEYSMTAPDRAQKILRLAAQPIGDQSAKHAWNELVSLSRLNSIDPLTGKLREIDLRREIFLQRLPETIRASLPEAYDISINELITSADKLLIAARASRRGQASAVSNVDTHEDEANIATATWPRRQPSRKYVTQQQTQFRGPTTEGKLSSLMPSGLCGYHSKFGPGAKRCFQGCLWHKLQSFVPKNGIAGRE